jgi:hypothetical protein
MPKLTILFGELFENEEIIELATSQSSSQTSTGGLSCVPTTSSSASHDSSFLLSWTYLPDGYWLASSQ